MRSQIDTVDRKLINLIAKRMQLVDEVADYKKATICQSFKKIE
ncbi:chorismate mutase [Leuconostoc fallax]